MQDIFENMQPPVIEKFTTTFPNCQLPLTTHSPLVISDSKDVLVCVMNESALHEQGGLYGLGANQVLSGVMDTDIRNSVFQGRLDLLSPDGNKSFKPFSGSG